MPINELRCITTFARTAELGSLRRAAEAQGISPQAASQALAQLEQHLGVRLFHRTTRNMALTDAGREFLEAARPSLAGLQRAMQVVRRSTEAIAGPLRIVGPRSTFLPDVQPDVQLDDRIGNWVEDRVDVGFRIGSSAADGVIARRLLPLPLIICAAPAYLLRHGAPNTLDDLSSHRCSVFRHPATGKVLPWEVRVGDGVVAHDVAPALCTNEEVLEISAVLAGQAIGVLTGVTATGHIRAGRLIPLLTGHVSDHLSLFIYYGNRTAQPARARAFIDLVVERLADIDPYFMPPKELAAAEARGRREARQSARRR